jgi:hypothetical protein
LLFIKWSAFNFLVATNFFFFFFFLMLDWPAKLGLFGCNDLG